MYVSNAKTGSIDTARYERWLTERSPDLLKGLELKKPTVRSLVYLALTETRKQPSSYEGLNRIIESKGVFKEPISTLSLRVALSDLSRRLPKLDPKLRIRFHKIGRKVQFNLEGEPSSPPVNLSTPLITPVSATNPQEIARSLVRDGGGLPFSALYCSYRAAANWITFSSPFAFAKKDYEAESLDGYHILSRIEKWSPSRRVGVCGVAVGEGLGEIELLGKLLRDTEAAKGFAVDYLPIDSSEFLLSCHLKLVQDRFKKEIRSGRLRISPVVGDLYQLKELLPLVRRRMGDSFLNNMPIVSTYFGNCIGNYENHEWEYFRSVLESFSYQQPLIFLVGASLTRNVPTSGRKSPVEEEKYFLDPFLLETPRHLQHDLGLLVSMRDGVPMSYSKEFVFDPNARPKLIRPLDYRTPQGIQGKVYRFFYSLKNDIRTWDGELSAKRGTDIFLYSVVKYHLESLTQFLQVRGLEIKAPPKDYAVLNTLYGEDTLHYVVFAAFRD